MLDRIKLSEMIKQPDIINHSYQNARLNINSVALTNGIKLYKMEWNVSHPICVPILIDYDMIQFSFGVKKQHEFGFNISAIDNKNYVGNFNSCGYIKHIPDAKFTFNGDGSSASVHVLIAPEQLLELLGETEPEFLAKIKNGESIFASCFNNEIQACANKLGQLLNSGTKVSPLQYQSYSLLLVSLLLDCYNINQNKTAVNSEPRIKQTRDLLLADLTNGVNLTELSKQACCSPSTLMRHFQQYYGSSIHAMYQKERMLLAKQKILTQGQSVTETAIELGYSNISHFSLAFRKQFGFNPSALKKQISSNTYSN